ncbi:deleted in malignant brain tumors 1 protein-like isoform X2 [Pimephales promelas]|uniref:deleted in malignant brain tumors 1 protein-like isoform X2 n=1 Tax=Pimephales promelas TaxID=90988 RepID=UPI0019557CF9|nr:deleted in malignant brain tumors 1 protein-like isoform X2 [Pimephales promelas]XP_039523685.1 deleted in malignant brain tumors 1 protein-like isoform X2 [Pimephales promelas]XP_039523686.1 deleted in malignant brain tumors 1 protein-like isoform X2 [Pimephales promelas]KAG1952752.1 deleted in malignant brain tumors 1 protein-like [Pimephales promelas]
MNWSTWTTSVEKSKDEEARNKWNFENSGRWKSLQKDQMICTLTLCFFSAAVLCTKWLILLQVLGNSTLSKADSVRLVDGSSSCSGRVQVLSFGVWGLVCYEGWDLLDANVVCRELGCGEAKEVKTAAYFGPSSEQVWINEAKCVGIESSLTECPVSSTDTLINRACIGDLYAGVICQLRTRLVSGFNSCSGRVEVLYNGIWGTVCDDDWDLSDAAVVCREMGCGDVIEAKSDAYFGEGFGEIWMDDVNCSETDHALSKCDFQPWGEHNCDHSEDAGVICQSLMRLVDDIDSCSGRVEVLHNGIWGSVCNNGWDLSDGAVVCREMGCGDIKQLTAYFFGATSRQIWMDDVNCTGEEVALSTCAFQGWGTHDCKFADHAGVICSPFSITYGDPDPGQDLHSRMKVLLRFEVKTDSEFNLNDPGTMSKLLEEMGKKLQISGPFSLTLKTQPDGKVFQNVSQKKKVP